MHSGKLTKIVATIGPASDKEDTMVELIKAGANVFRFNTKHNTNEWHRDRINLTNKVSKDLGISIGVLVDLQGPEIRIDTYEGTSFDVSKNDFVLFADTFNLNETILELYPKHKIVRIPQSEVFTALDNGDEFSIDDGFIDFKVEEKHRNYLIAKCMDDGVIKNRKGLNLIGKDVDVPSLTDGDKERIDMAADAGADYIALSFVRSSKDVEGLRAEMKHRKCFAKIVSKIESQKGVDNIDEIIESSDAIMIARGDLGIEIPIERVTHLQKDIIRKCRNSNKPVIVATQMLQSMIDSPRPTRAEAADVANAIFDETDAIMLSGETASGKYPVKAVEMMKRIAKYNESKKDKATAKPKLLTQTHYIVNAAISVLNESESIKIEKLIVFTESGFTARVISSFRPHIPVLAISESKSTCESLTLSYGINAFRSKISTKEYGYPEEVINNLKSAGLLVSGEVVLLVHGRNFRESGSTNALVMFTVK